MQLLGWRLPLPTLALALLMATLLALLPTGVESWSQDELIGVSTKKNDPPAKRVTHPRWSRVQPPFVVWPGMVPESSGKPQVVIGPASSVYSKTGGPRTQKESPLPRKEPKPTSSPLPEPAVAPVDDSDQEAPAPLVPPQASDPLLETEPESKPEVKKTWAPKTRGDAWKRRQLTPTKKETPELEEKPVTKAGDKETSATQPAPVTTGPCAKLNCNHGRCDPKGKVLCDCEPGYSHVDGCLAPVLEVPQRPSEVPRGQHLFSSVLAFDWAERDSKEGQCNSLTEENLTDIIRLMNNACKRCNSTLYTMIPRSGRSVALVKPNPRARSSAGKICSHRLRVFVLGKIEDSEEIEKLLDEDFQTWKHAQSHASRGVKREGVNLLPHEPHVITNSMFSLATEPSTQMHVMSSNKALGLLITEALSPGAVFPKPRVNVAATHPTVLGNPRDVSLITRISKGMSDWTLAAIGFTLIATVALCCIAMMLCCAGRESGEGVYQQLVSRRQEEQVLAMDVQLGNVVLSPDQARGAENAARRRKSYQSTAIAKNGELSPPLRTNGSAQPDETEAFLREDDCMREGCKSHWSLICPMCDAEGRPPFRICSQECLDTAWSGSQGHGLLHRTAQQHQFAIE